MKIMSKMIKSSNRNDSDSKSKASAEGWKKNINLVQQMFITQQYKKDNGMHLEDKNIGEIEKDKLEVLLKRAKKAKLLKRSWEVYTVQRVGPKRQKIPKEQSIGQNNQRYADIYVMV